jgi:hypothetical protein
MHVVAIHGWKDVSPELVQALAASVGITPYEMRQRLIGDGPSVMASFSDPQQARALAMKLNLAGVAAMTVDTDGLRSAAGRFVVRRFELRERGLYLEDGNGQTVEIAYADIDLLLSGTRILGQTETLTVTERKLSLGKTILSGGIPLTKKVERQEEITSEERENLLYLYAAERPPVLFSQGGMTYDGFGPAMKLSRELNFAFLKSELRRLCPGARHDDRLVNRLGQVRLLGPALNPEHHLDLAFHILARTLRGSVMAG